MQPREQFDTGVDAGRNDAALKRAEPGRAGRLRVRTARSLAAVLLVAFAAILALPPQAEAQTTGIGGLWDYEAQYTSLLHPFYRYRFLRNRKSERVRENRILPSLPEERA